MIQNKYLRIASLSIAFFSFFLSNVSAFYGPILWLSPAFVLGEAIIWVVIAGISTWYLKKLYSFAPLFEKIKRNWIILPFAVFSGLSIFWSIYWQISLYRWVILICTILVGGYIGLSHDLKTVIKFLSIFGIFILLLCTIYVFLVPNIGVMNYYNIQGAWRGIYWHKNHMGLIASFLNILFLINIIRFAQSKSKQMIFWSFLYAYSLLFVYQSDSAAAYITTLFLHGMIFISLLWIKFRSRIRKSHYLFALGFIILAIVILIINANQFLGIFNRNTSLTGRIPMWTYLFKTYLSQRPIGGYGFNAFWYLSSHRAVLQQAAGYPDPIVISDNGFIDILINTGLLGLVLFFIFYFGLWWRSIKYAIKSENIIGFVPLVIMTFTLIANVSWSLMFENESFFMLIMMVILFSISSQTSRTTHTQDRSEVIQA